MVFIKSCKIFENSVSYLQIAPAVQAATVVPPGTLLQKLTEKKNCPVDTSKYKIGYGMDVTIIIIVLRYER